MAQHLTMGTLLHGGTYIIDQVLGQGSFGITYLAEHVSLGKKVALKEFFMKELNSRSDDGSITGLTDGSLSYNYGQKFKKEAQNLARLEHPNIVRVTDCFEENGTYYYVMDYIEGDNLNDYIKAHVMSEQEAVSVIRDIANALAYMHNEKHMLHLDLKPGNIMRRRSDGHVYLIDFGLSKHYDSKGAPETSTTIGLGTAGYAPIEQSNQAKNGEFRPTIDVYALGATLYKLLTRETPPAASELVSDEDLLQDKLKFHKVSPTIADAVLQAMQPSVKKRTQTVADFISSLSATAPTPPVPQIPTAPVTPASSSEETIVTPVVDNPGAIPPQIPVPPQTPEPPQIPPYTSQEPEDDNTNIKKIVIIAIAIAVVLIGICLAVNRCSGNSTYDDTWAEDSDSVWVDPADTIALDSAVAEDYVEEDYSSGYHEITYDDGSTYSGEWKDGNWHGYGVATWPKEKNCSYRYEGQWKNGVRSGSGVEYYDAATNDDLKKYEGNFVNDERSGYGVGYYPDGTYYKGKWRKGAWHGQGTYVHADGTEESAEWS